MHLVHKPDYKQQSGSNRSRSESETEAKAGKRRADDTIPWLPKEGTRQELATSHETSMVATAATTIQDTGRVGTELRIETR
jgi:hypothetical protein